MRSKAMFCSADLQDKVMVLLYDLLTQEDFQILWDL